MKELYAKYVEPNAGFDYNKKDCENFLVLNQYYKVEKVNMGQSSTSIHLKGISCCTFNSVNFSFYLLKDGKFIKHDIFKDEDYNPYLPKTKYTFTGKDGKEYTFRIGDRVITQGGDYGEIISFCFCEWCEERGFFEPRVNYKIGGERDITIFDYNYNFGDFYKIGDYQFGEKPSEDTFKERLSEIEKELKNLNFQRQCLLDLQKELYE